MGVSTAQNHVICQSYTCPACADAIVHSGGTPVIVDVETETFSLSLDAVECALEKDSNIVGILVVSCYGIPGRDLHAIRRLCDKRHLWLLEDNCESYGAESAGVPVGCIGEMSVLSVRSEKLIGAGEGGAIMSNNRDLINRARWWCSRAAAQSGRLWEKYFHEAVGQNYLMPELVAAVALAGAESLPNVIAKKREINSWYRQHFSQCQTPTSADQGVFWINAVRLPIPAEAVGMELIRRCPGIEIRPGFYPLHQQPPFGECSRNQSCPNAETLFKHVICLPSSVRLAREDVEYICKNLQDVIAEIKAG